MFVPKFSIYIYIYGLSPSATHRRELHGFGKDHILILLNQVEQCYLKFC